jgi:tetratricopeptide (TPR) repeat protein
VPVRGDISESHWHKAGCHRVLGKFLQAAGESAAARSEFEAAIAIDDTMLGPEALNVAHDHYSLACLLVEVGDLDGARAHAERAELVHLQALDGQHPSTLRDQQLLAKIARLDGQARE